MKIALECFYKALGVEYDEDLAFIGDTTVGVKSAVCNGWNYIDPAGDEVPLEVLWKGLEELARKRYGVKVEVSTQYGLVKGDWVHRIKGDWVHRIVVGLRQINSAWWDDDAIEAKDTDLRTALISAIERLITEAEE